jgi:Xaa-Pro aminopeptidase
MDNIAQQPAAPLRRGNRIGDRAMFQSFDVRGGPAQGRAAVPALRAKLAEAGLDGFFIPHEDEWNNEYLPDCTERLAWATGFTGSAGCAIVMATSAHLFVDGRYTLQGAAQTDPELFQQHDLVAEGPAGWLASAGAPHGARIGYDPRVISPDALARLESAAKARAITLVACDRSPLDAAWTMRPDEPTATIVPHPVEFSGEESASKRARIAEALRAAGQDVAVLTSPAALAWLFNIRGGDVTRTPLPLGSALLASDGTATLFVKPQKVTAPLRAFLGNEVSIAPDTEFAPALAGLGGRSVLVDPALSSAAVFAALEAAGASVVRGQDPTIVPRATKNAVELAGTRRAHQRDGAALSRFLAWFDTAASDGTLTEIEACRKLEEFRRATGALQDLSFDSISGAGPNGALPHYRVTVDSDLTIELGTLFLIDSGGQYLDGTTDVTRTIAVGTPSEEMRDRFTRVLKGHIALSRVRFPPQTPGCMLDTLARLALWEAGLDYDHGTGHGVGSYLGVHEGPQRIAKAWSPAVLLPGMILSNEPGYYKTGAWGIRTENLQVVTPAEEVAGGERPMHGFETLTLAPIDRRLVETGLLTAQEREWLNAYHARVLAEIGPRLEGSELAWLEAATAPV